MYEELTRSLARLLADTMNAEGSSLEQLRTERDAARSEAAALRTQVSKLNYRVEHLKQHVRVEEPSSTN